VFYDSLLTIISPFNSFARLWSIDVHQYCSTPPGPPLHLIILLIWLTLDTHEFRSSKRSYAITPKHCSSWRPLDWRGEGLNPPDPINTSANFFIFRFSLDLYDIVAHRRNSCGRGLLSFQWTTWTTCSAKLEVRILWVWKAWQVGHKNDVFTLSITVRLITHFQTSNKAQLWMAKLFNTDQCELIIWFLGASTLGLSMSESFQRRHDGAASWLDPVCWPRTK
jgi:hypothetical protein